MSRRLSHELCERPLGLLQTGTTYLSQCLQHPLLIERFYKGSNLCYVNKEFGDMFIRLQHLRGPLSHD